MFIKQYQVITRGDLVKNQLPFLLLLKLFIPRVDYFIKLMVGGFFRQLGFVLPVMSKGFYPLEGLCLLLLMMVLINSYLAMFNLIPIPPLDGSQVARVLVGMSHEMYHNIARYGFIILIIVLQIPFVQHTLGAVTFKSYSIMGGWMGLVV